MIQVTPEVVPIFGKQTWRDIVLMKIMVLGWLMPMLQLPWRLHGLMLVHSKTSRRRLELVELSLPYNSTITSERVISGSGISKIEFIEVRVNISHSDWGELEIQLERDGGLTSTLTKQHNCYNQSYSVIDCTVAGNSFRFGVAKHMGESADATWRLKVTDKENSANATGTLNSWSIKFYGE